MSTLNDDLTELDAALAFLDAYDGDIDFADIDTTTTTTTSESSDTSSPSVTPASRTADRPHPPIPRATQPTKKRRGRQGSVPRAVSPRPLYPSQNRKEELDYLRQQVAELDEKLRILKQHVHTDPGVVSSTKDTSSMWETIAMHQFEQRQQSEIENQRLRRLLESQLKLARGLERLLKRSNTDLFLESNVIKRAKRNRTQGLDPQDDPTIFSELFSVLETMQTELTTVFADPHYADETMTIEDVDVNHNDVYGTTVDVFDARSVPFPLRATADAVWSYFASSTTSTDGYTRGPPIESTDDTIQRHFGFSVTLHRHEAYFRGRLAGRRFFYEDQIVILWVARVEPNVPGATATMLVRQQGWTVVKRLDETVTRIESKYIAIPFVFDDGSAEYKRRVGMLTNFVLQSVHSHVQTSRRVVENVLLASSTSRTPS